MYKARILITLRKTILDPQGKAVEHSLKSLGYGNIVDTRIGKYVLNHSFMMPGLISTAVAVGMGLLMIQFFS